MGSVGATGGRPAKSLIVHILSLSVHARIAKAMLDGIIMKLPRRSFLHLAAGAAALPGCVADCLGANLSIKAGRIVGISAGASSDTTSRILRQ